MTPKNHIATPKDHIAMFDVIHGPITFEEGRYFDNHAALAFLLQSAPILRLQGIRQLPFASALFPGADHTRYAHSIGTAHVAMMIVRRLDQRDFFGESWLN